MNFFSLVSIVPLFLAAGMAWLAKGSVGYPEQRAVGVVLWFFLAATSYFALRIGDLPVHWTGFLILLFSLAGFFFDTVLSLIFKDPAKAPPE